MKTGVRLLLSSVSFAVVIAAAYGYFTHDIVGVIFLGMMALALIIVAGFIVIAEREAHLEGDKPDLTPLTAAGEELGTFSLESYWPITAALGTIMLISGVVFLPGVSLGLALSGAALLAWSIRFLVREST